MSAVKIAYISPVPASGVPSTWPSKSCRGCDVTFCGRPAKVARSSYCSLDCFRADQSRLQVEILNRDSIRATGKPFQPTAKTIRCRRWETKYPGRRAAQRAVQRALANGQLLPALECEHCGDSGRRITYHHWSYSQHHRLDVEPLCPPCHRIADNLRSLGERAGYLPHEILSLRWSIQDRFQDAEIVQS